MVRPVRIQHTDLCHRGISVLLALKVVLDVLEVLECHGKSQGIIELPELLLFQVLKPVKDLDICRLVKFCHKGLRLVHTGLPGIHRVDAVMFDCLKLLIRQFSPDHIGGCGADNRLLIFLYKLYTLLGRVRSLVKLSREELYRKDPVILRCRKCLFIQNVYRRLRKNTSAGFFKSLL